MRAIHLLTCALVAISATSAAAQDSGNARAGELVRALHLTVLPKESGYLEHFS
jgi:hypothetical protein